MNDRIALALTKNFDRHRIVFWYDTKKELRDTFESLTLPDVVKLELTNNEYGVKHRLLREQPEQKFLLYREGPQPVDLDNWLLDVQLAHGEFRADQGAIWLSELELGPEFHDLMQDHGGFFQAAKRREALKKVLKANDTPGLIRLKMLAVCTGCEPRLDGVVEHLLQELATGKDEKMKLIKLSSLDGFFWEQMTRCYGYRSDNPGLRDFAIELFKSCFAMATDGAVKMTQDALVFLQRWKNNRQFEEAFRTLSTEYSEVLGMERNLAQWEFRKLIDLDYFRLIDLKILSDLVREVAARTLSSSEVSSWVRQRQPSFWYPEFRDLYEAVDYAARFMSALGEANLTMENLANGVQRYSRTWYPLDQYYRKYIYHVHKAGQASLTGQLTEQMENLYANNFLLKVGDRFQECVDLADHWEARPVPRQKDFFELWVRPFLEKDNKVCVIISDALRYEAGQELQKLICQQDRYTAELEPALAMLPSYTQLGMAALLPNKVLAIVDDDTSTVLVDGQSAQGTPNRVKILGQAGKLRATARKSDEIMALNKDDCRALLRDHDVLYVYHNRIDATGDKRESEERVFEAVEETFQDLIQLIKKLTSANASNLLVTSDHGFIYQNRAIDESDFAGCEVKGDRIFFQNRRFVLGTGLQESSSLRKFTPQQLGLTGSVEVQIPKSINRLRLKGSGSRFVHGGASLQEVVIPVLRINKKRQSDITTVEVELLRGDSSMITSGQLAVTMYQEGPVTDKIQARVLRAGIYTQAGELISNSFELTFDCTSENPRDRERQVRFVLTHKADEANGQEVFLKLDEQHAGTSHYKDYKSLSYLIRRSFTSDFDF